MEVKVHPIHNTRGTVTLVLRLMHMQRGEWMATGCIWTTIQMRSLAPLLHLLTVSFLLGKELLYLLLFQVCSEVIKRPTWGHAHRGNNRIYLSIAYSTGLQ